MIAIPLPVLLLKLHIIRFGMHLFKNHSEQSQVLKELIWSYERI